MDPGHGRNAIETIALDKFLFSFRIKNSASTILFSYALSSSVLCAILFFLSLVPFLAAPTAGGSWDNL